MKQSQNQKVINHLKTNRTITSMEAFAKYRITRLSARISDLREQGYAIITDMVTGKNEDGNTCTYAKYRLAEEKDL